jgi:hypothetical protein
MTARDREVVNEDVGALTAPNDGRRKVEAVLLEQALSGEYLEGPELQRAIPSYLRLWFVIQAKG